MARALKIENRPGRYGSFGGQFVAPVLLPVLDRLETGFRSAWADPAFHSELTHLLNRFVGRPTPIFDIPAFPSRPGGARIVLKRDDLTFNGGNYANSAVGQCLLARRMGLSAVVTDTGSGQNGIATAAVAARFGMRCTIYMGARDAAAQPQAVKKMRLFGAKLEIVEDADRALSSATSAAIRHWMGHSGTDAYVAGAPIGPHPYPEMVAAFQQVIGKETRLQLVEGGVLPSAVLSAVGGGSSTIGLFSTFVPDPSIRLIAVEAAGTGERGAPNAARLSQGRRGIFHGAENARSRRCRRTDPCSQFRGARPCLSGLRAAAGRPCLPRARRNHDGHGSGSAARSQAAGRDGGRSDLPGSGACAGGCRARGPYHGAA